MKRFICQTLTLFALSQAVQGEVQLDVPGAAGALEDNLRSRMRLHGEACDAPRWRVRRLFARVDEDVDPALRAFGYYDATLSKQLETAGDCWQAQIHIDLGERTRIRRRSVVVHGEAAEDPELEALLAGLPLREGEPLNHGDYEDIKSRLSNFAARRGYLDFRFSRRQLRVYPEEAAAEIDIQADSGPRYRFGEMRFGDHPLDDRLVRRLARVQRGEPYDTRRLAAIDRDLSDAGYFQRVEVRPLREQSQDLEVPVEIRLEAAPRHAWRAGVGFATDTGPRLSLGYENRYLNASGHTLESGLRLSPVESELVADYLIPGTDPHSENFSFGARLAHEDTDSTTVDSATLAVRQTVKTDGWTQTRFLELLHENATVGDDTDSYTLLMPGVSVDRVRADDLLRTRKGYRFTAEVRGSQRGLLSTVSMLRLRVGAKGIYRFGDSGRVTARVDAGATLGDSTADLPATLRFFAGGDQSVRGYEYKSLGPVDSNGNAEGGRNLLTGSVEYEHPVFGEDWWLAAFVDGGNAYDTDAFDPKFGYGAGVRWYSPIGRLRLDLAFPDDTTADEWRIHFGLGADL